MILIGTCEVALQTHRLRAYASFRAAAGTEVGRGNGEEAGGEIIYRGRFFVSAQILGSRSSFPPLFFRSTTISRCSCNFCCL